MPDTLEERKGELVESLRKHISFLSEYAEKIYSLHKNRSLDENASIVLQQLYATALSDAQNSIKTLKEVKQISLIHPISSTDKESKVCERNECRHQKKPVLELVQNKAT